ncbi:MAG: flagellar protein FlgN [Gammaproteobacteria bacterium]|nr:flagellar protein FlgN [Gammaproteobacteria bacterium]
MKTQPEPQQDIDQVSAHLGAGITLFQHLIITLKNERAHLEANDHTSFHESTQQKQQCLLLVSQHEAALNQLLESLNIEQGNKTIDLLINRFDPEKSGSFTQTAQLYRSLLGQCDDLNTINGRFIQRSQTNANRMLDLLKGSIEKNQTYTRLGKTRSEGGKHPIAKA